MQECMYVCAYVQTNIHACVAGCRDAYMCACLHICVCACWCVCESRKCDYHGGGEETLQATDKHTQYTPMIQDTLCACRYFSLPDERREQVQMIHTMYAPIAQTLLNPHEHNPPKKPKKSIHMCKRWSSQARTHPSVPRSRGGWLAVS